MNKLNYWKLPHNGALLGLRETLQFVFTTSTLELQSNKVINVQPVNAKNSCVIYNCSDVIRMGSTGSAEPVNF